MFNILFVEPEIPGNTGNAIRLAAVTGAHLHLVEPLGFDLEDSKLRRAGLDYHDLAHVTIHPTLEKAFEELAEHRIFAFTTDGAQRYDRLEYQPGDVLMFGRESVGLSPEHKNHPRITSTLALPMLASRRSMNLANTASIALYEAWKQHDFQGALSPTHPSL